jgi:hypothetical protein
MNLLSIDPGNVESAYCVFNGSEPLDFDKLENSALLMSISVSGCQHLAIETMFARGMPTAQEEMETQLWAGRFIQASGLPFTQIRRLDEKIVLCGSARATDANIRQAIIDRFGGEFVAIGGKKCKACHGKGVRGRKHDPCDVCGASKYEFPPGPLHGMSGDCWSALAIAITWFERYATQESGVNLVTPALTADARSTPRPTNRCG